VRKLFTRLEEIVKETISVQGDYGPTALGIFRKKKSNDNEISLETDEKSDSCSGEPPSKRRRIV
jgi:hypothetical protein